MRAIATTYARLSKLSHFLTVPAIALALAALWLNLIGLDDSGILDRSKIAPDSGLAFRVEPPRPFQLLASPGDSTNAPSQSKFELFENNVPLIAHVLHATIRENGHGTFSHWGSVVWFSSTDGTDPRLNGRTYRFERRLFLLDSAAMLLVLCAAVVTWPLLRSTIRLLRSVTAGGVGRHQNLTIRKTAVVYMTLFALLSLAITLRIGYDNAPSFHAALGGNLVLPSRVKYYLQNPRSYTVVFLGDSRVYCAIHPEIIEKYVPEMHGLNLAHFTNWLPTQHSMLRDIVAKIPEGTTVVWSVGHAILFKEAPIPVQRVYPIALYDAAWLLWWDRSATLSGLLDNISYFHWPLYFPIALRDMHDRLNIALKIPLTARLLSETVATPGPVTALVSPVLPSRSEDGNRAELIRTEALRDPNVADAVITTDQGNPTSVVVYFKRGGYFRIEINSAFFRDKQKETTKTVSRSDAARFQPPEFDPLRWRLFTTMLDIFAEHGVKLIVNELEEAPHTYGNFEVREKWRQAMRERVQPEVERRGFVYARANFDAINDEDYFDYNHLNSSGVAKYSPMIAEIIAREINK